MSELPHVSVDGQAVLTLPPTLDDHPSCLVFGMHKGGSSLLDRLVGWLCRLNQRPFVPVMRDFFAAGVDVAAIPAETAEIFRPTGYVYGSFRAFPRTFGIPILADAPQVLLIRDPRDMLTSLYFSMRKAPPGPAALNETRAKALELEIDDLVLRTADTYLAAFDDYERHLVPERLLLLRYEDVVYDKTAFITQVAGHLGLDVPPDRLPVIAARLDERPNTDRPDQHVRQMHPGDHARKLRPETVARLNERFAPILDRHGYERR